MPVASIERVWNGESVTFLIIWLIYFWIIWHIVGGHTAGNERNTVINPIGSPECDCPFSGSTAHRGGSNLQAIRLGRASRKARTDIGSRPVLPPRMRILIEAFALQNPAPRIASR
jgi:hypothetical protein